MNEFKIVTTTDGTDFRDNKVTVVLKKEGKTVNYVKLHIAMIENNQKLCEKYLLKKFLPLIRQIILPPLYRK